MQVILFLSPSLWKSFLEGWRKRAERRGKILESNSPTEESEEQTTNKQKQFPIHFEPKRLTYFV